MISAAAVQAEFETTDGLRVKVTLQVADEHGNADRAINAIFNGISDYIESQNRIAAVIDQLAEETEPNDNVIDLSEFLAQASPVDEQADACDCPVCSGHLRGGYAE